MMRGPEIIRRYPHTLAVGAGRWLGLQLAVGQNIYTGPVPVWHGLGFHILVARYSGVCLYIRLRTAAANLLKRDIPQNKISTLNMAKHQGEKIRITEFSPENSISKAPSGTSDKEPACQCKRCKRLRFNPWVGKIP